MKRKRGRTRKRGSTTRLRGPNEVTKVAIWSRRVGPGFSPDEIFYYDIDKQKLVNRPKLYRTLEAIRKDPLTLEYEDRRLMLKVLVSQLKEDLRLLAIQELLGCVRARRIAVILPAAEEILSYTLADSTAEDANNDDRRSYMGLLDATIREAQKLF